MKCPTAHALQQCILYYNSTIEKLIRKQNNMCLKICHHREKRSCSVYCHNSWSSYSRVHTLLFYGTLVCGKHIVLLIAHVLTAWFHICFPCFITQIKAIKRETCVNHVSTKGGSCGPKKALIFYTMLSATVETVYIYYYYCNIFKPLGTDWQKSTTI